MPQAQPYAPFRDIRGSSWEIPTVPHSFAPSWSNILFPVAFNWASKVFDLRDFFPDVPDTPLETPRIQRCLPTHASAAEPRHRRCSKRGRDPIASAVDSPMGAHHADAVGRDLLSRAAAAHRHSIRNRAGEPRSAQPPAARERTAPRPELSESSLGIDASSSDLPQQIGPQSRYRVCRAIAPGRPLTLGDRRTMATRRARRRAPAMAGQTDRSA